MSFFKDLKGKLLGGGLSREEPVKRNKRFMNYDESTTVGIIYDVQDVNQHETIKRYIKHLKEEEGMKEVSAMGFWDSKEDIPTFLQAVRHFDWFTQAEISGNGAPDNDQSNAFADKEFDILIDLSFESHVPLVYLLKRSRARCKVGFPAEEREDLLDIIVEADLNKSVLEAIDHVNFYLTILNKKAQTA